MIPFVRMLTSSWTSRNLHDMIRAWFFSRSWVKSYSWIHIWLLLQIYMAMLSKLWHLASPCDTLPMEHGETCGKFPILKVWYLLFRFSMFNGMAVGSYREITGELHVTPEHRHPISVSGVKGLQTWQVCVTCQQLKCRLTSCWLNQPHWKICASNWVHLPQGSGLNIKKTFELPPPVILLSQPGWR